MIPSAGCHLLIYIINVRHSIGESLCDTYCPKPLEIELSVQGVAKTVNSSTEVFHDCILQGVHVCMRD